MVEIAHTVHQAVRMSYLASIVSARGKAATLGPHKVVRDGRNERSEYYPKWADVEFYFLIM